MTGRWKIVDSVPTDEGTMTLLEREPGEFIIRMHDYVLMNSRLSLTERALGSSTCGAPTMPSSPTVLIGGLGMGFTLRAALDALPAGAAVTVAELNPVVVRWCRGPLSRLTGGAVEDPRVTIRIADVAELITRAGTSRPYNAILLDLYQGTHDANSDPAHPFFGTSALQRTHRALSAGGVLGVWTETRDDGFEARLERVGFEVQRTRPGKGGPRHVVYLATRTVSEPARKRLSGGNRRR